MSEVTKATRSHDNAQPIRMQVSYELLTFKLKGNPINNGVENEIILTIKG